MRYELKAITEYEDDINLVLKYIDSKGYVIKDREHVTKTKTANKNIFHNIFTDDVLVDQFDNGVKHIKAEFSKLYDNTGSIIENVKAGNVCTITRAETCDMPIDLIKQYNRMDRIEVDPCTYDKSRVELGGNRIAISEEEYRASLDTHLLDYNRRCSIYFELVDGKKVYPDSNMKFGQATQFAPLLKKMNYAYERAALKGIRKKLKFNGSSIEEQVALVEEYLTAMRVPDVVDKFKNLNLENSYKRITAYVLLHWMWLVKRNLSDDPHTVEELFINIHGAQSSGKTTFVEDLSHALQFFFAEADVKAISDPRESKLFANKRIVFFDEFGGKSRLTLDEVAALKKIITGGDIHQRIMHTNEHTVLKRKFSGMSATNIPLSDTVKDETGARRYFEIITDTMYDKSGVVHFDFEFLDGKKHTEDNGKSSYLDLWQVVDDTIETGYISIVDSIREDVRKIQSTYVPLSSSVQFLTSDECTFVDRHYFADHTDFKAKVESKEISQDDYNVYGITELYKRYCDWCKVNNLEQAKTMGNFKRDLEELPILVEPRKRGKNSDGTPKLQNFYYVYVGSDNPSEV